MPPEPLPRRPLGKTGESLSVVGFGGIIVMDETPADAAKFVGEAIDEGCNYFDVAPSYGNAEERLGPALEPYRKNIFLACKTTERKKADAAKELRNSLKLLRTDHVDVYQMHALTTEEDTGTAFGPGGALEAFIEAKAAGLTRFLGFSAHSEEGAMRAMETGSFDTILFPFSLGSWRDGHFGPRVLEVAKKRGMGLLALKALGKRALKDGEARPWKKCWYGPVDTYEEALAGIRFTLSLGVTAAVSPSHIELFRWAVRAAREFTPLPPGEIPESLRAAAAFSPIFTASR
ncbi:MAG: aldo/keto reductase [Candidatus Coatesbacteria bacterium]